VSTFPANIAQSAQAKPAWLPEEGVLARLRTMRRDRRLLRSLIDGDLRAALLDTGATQHKWSKILRRDADGSESANEMVININVIDLAMEMHAIIATGTPMTIAMDGDDDDAQDARQSAFLDRFRRENLFDAQAYETAYAANAEGVCTLRVGQHEGEPAIFTEDPDTALPLGPDGPDGQPTVWERRWVIERAPTATNRNRERFLRVERQRRINGAWTIESEAYATDTKDTLLDLAELKRVPLAKALAPGEALPPEIAPSGLRDCTLMRYYTSRYRGTVRPRIRRGDLSLVDAVAAAITRMARVAAIHGDPKWRVPPNLIKADGTVDISDVTFDDPERLLEMIAQAFDWEGIAMVFRTLIQWFLTQTRMSASLIGFKPDGGAAPDTVEKLTLEATVTLAVAKQASIYMDAAFGRMLTTLCELHAMTALGSEGGYPVRPVRANLHPELPKDAQQLARELAERRNNGQLSDLSMLEQLHGPTRAIVEMERMDKQRDAEADRQQRSLGFAVGMNGGGM
jgi:hypothetical protein